MKERTKRILQMLIERANELKEDGYDEVVTTTGAGFRFERTKDGLFSGQFDLAPFKDRKAAVLLLRQFTSGKDHISFNKLQNLLDDAGLSPRWKESFGGIYKTYKEYLDGHPVGIESGFFSPGNHLTRCQILRAGLSYLSHADLSNRDRQNYEEWTREEIRAAVFTQAFDRILGSILVLIYRLSDLTQQELETNRSIHTPNTSNK